MSSQPELETSRLPRSNSGKSSTARNQEARAERLDEDLRFPFLQDDGSARDNEPSRHVDRLDDDLSALLSVQGSDVERSYEDRVRDRAAECVAEFREHYPHLANQPLSRTPGQTLRRELVEFDISEQHVEEADYVPPGDRLPGEEDEAWDNSFTVDYVNRAQPVTWAEALKIFLIGRQPYDDGLGGVFESRVDGETFTIDFDDCWTTGYGDEQAAKNAAAQRQLMGGTYPIDDRSAVAGEHNEGVWGSTATIMLTRTGSAKPDGDWIPPVDHYDAVARTWSQGGVYDRVRDACQYHLGLDPDQWGFIRGDDVHGLGVADDPDETPGVNACRPHCHDAIYIDLEATGLRDRFDSDEEIKTVLENHFYRAIEKHVEECDLAEPVAHTREKAIEVRLHLENPGGYATEYLRLQEGEDMMDMPVEFQAFAALAWAQNRQRIARSNLFNEAADADLCIQDEETAHGFRLMYDSQGDVVCAECGSSVGIDAQTISEYRLNNPEPQAVATDGGSIAEEHGEITGAKLSQPVRDLDLRERVEEFIETHGCPDSAAVLLGMLDLSEHYLPLEDHLPLVREVMAGLDLPEAELEVEYSLPELPPEYELVAIDRPDGTREEVNGSGGGVETVDLVLPEEVLLSETRLRHLSADSWITIRCAKDRFRTHKPREMAEYLVDEYGVTDPWYAELLLEFGSTSCDLPDELQEPEAHPPPDVSP